MSHSISYRIVSIFVLISVLFSFTACLGEEAVTDETTVGALETESSESNASESMETESNNVNTTESSEIEETETEAKTNLIVGEEVEYAANFAVSKVFGNNMVIQRNEYVRVWGWAEESENGKKVSATFMGERADAIIEDGEWEIVFYQKHAASKNLGNSLMIHNGGDVEYVFENILIGDVFMVIGQSNVQYDINNYLAAEPDLKWTKDQLKEDSIIRMNYNSNIDNKGYPVRGTADVCEDVVTKKGLSPVLPLH